MQQLSQYILIIEKALAENPYAGTPQNLYDPINYILSLGGKRVRPVLTLMGYEMIAGTIDPKALDTALAIEVFHNFTLVHDDIMDKAPLRRGKPTVHHKWNDTTAILAGDAMLIKAYELLAKLDADRLKSVLPLFNRTAIEVCEGQQMDMNFETRQQVFEADYIQMITLKTAVLLGCALSAGALAAGGSAIQADHLYHYGKHIGIAFQLMDDWLDAFGDHRKVGKLQGGDIIANKKTYLYIKAMEKADAVQQKVLQTWYTSTPDQPADKITAVMTIFKNLGIEQEVMNLMAHEEQVAMAHLEASGIADEALTPLRNLTAFLKHREQ